MLKFSKKETKICKSASLFYRLYCHFKLRNEFTARKKMDLEEIILTDKCLYLFL